MIKYDEIANQKTWILLPEDQKERVFGQDMVDIEPSFLGFMAVYYSLSKIIPKHFTVVDLGCAYNPQCFLFKDHKKYIAVDLGLPGRGKTERFKSDNCEIYEMSIGDFIKKYLKNLNLKETIAICSYVPLWHNDNMKLARDNFINVFTYYPHGNLPNILNPGNN